MKSKKKISERKSTKGNLRLKSKKKKEIYEGKSTIENL